MWYLFLRFQLIKYKANSLLNSNQCRSFQTGLSKTNNEVCSRPCLYSSMFRKPVDVGTPHLTDRRWSAGTPSSEELSWCVAAAEHPQLSDLLSSALSIGTSAKKNTRQLWSLRTFNVRVKKPLLLFLCQKSLPPGDEVSLTSSSWSRYHWEF